jgi:hypothetical protein
MRSFVLLAALVALLAASGPLALGASAGQEEVGLGLGVGVKVPLVVFVQLRFPKGFAVEAGLAGTGPGVFAAKLYTRELELFDLAFRPFIGAGAAIVIFPWGIATGFFGLAGLEYPLPKTPLRLFGEVGLALEPADPPRLRFGADLGVRLDFF